MKKELVQLEKNIHQNLAIKSILKQEVFENTIQTFQLLKSGIEDVSENFNKKLFKLKERVRFEMRDHGDFVVQLRVAGDRLVFSQHTNTFEFDRNHKIWEMPYVKDDPLNSYCGMISVYNFLDDSFKYNRMDDLGYLIARIFINKSNHFFVEEKRQNCYHYKNFGKETIASDAIRKFLLNVLVYTLQFDLLVPPYDTIKIATVGQMTEKMNFSQIKTGKRLGFQFNSDDVLGDKNSA